MSKNVSGVMEMMINYYGADIKRINHFIKVYGFAKHIGESLCLSGQALEILEIAALTHDIGIKVSEEKYQSSAGQYQEKEGPGVAQKKLSALGIDQEIIDRVCFLIGHHHTYAAIDGPDFQALVEADFLVNIFEDSIHKNAIRSIGEKVFKTATGSQLLGAMYLEV